MGGTGGRSEGVFLGVTSGAAGNPIIVFAPFTGAMGVAGGAGAAGGGGSDAGGGSGSPIIVRVPCVPFFTAGAAAGAPVGAGGGSEGVGAIPRRVCLPRMGCFSATWGVGAPGGAIGKVIPSGCVEGRRGASEAGRGAPHAAQVRREDEFSVPQRGQAGMSRRHFSEPDSFPPSSF